MGFLETKYSDYLYVAFRVGVGALFLMLGIQKLFGLWGMPEGIVVVGNLIWFAGVFEVMIGMSLLVGVLVRLASFFGVIQMIVAYYIGHVVYAGSWNPTMNMGMATLIFGLAFVATLTYGAGTLSLEKKVLGKELF